jgi:uncharacterized protein (TIGR01244 family)
MQKPIELDDRVSVSDWLAPEDFADLAERGVTLVVNNRPDGEADDQMTAAQAAEIADRHGIDYRHVPVTMDTLSAADVDAFKAALDAADGKVHAHCRSGARSATLWAISEVCHRGRDRGAVREHAAARGVDCTPAMRWIERNVN